MENQDIEPCPKLKRLKLQPLPEMATVRATIAIARSQRDESFIFPFLIEALLTAASIQELRFVGVEHG